MIKKGKYWASFILVFSLPFFTILSSPISRAESSYSFANSIARLGSDEEATFAHNEILFYDPCAGDKDDDNSVSCTEVEGDKITWIGDSYSVGAQSIIESQFPGISFGDSVNDANSTIQVSKFISYSPANNPSALDILDKLVSDNDLKPFLVMAIGTNGGGWKAGEIERFESIISNAPDTKVVFVNAKRPIEDYAEGNKLLEDLVNSNDNYSLADWASVYDASFFTQDNIHPSGNGGYEKWVETIVNAMPEECEGAGKLPGNTTIEKVWNRFADYFNEAGVSGVNTSALISGILGNLKLETGILPFLTANNYYGMHMMYGPYGGSTLKQLVDEEVGADYWHGVAYGDPDQIMASKGIPESAIDKAIDVEVQIYTLSGTVGEKFLSRVGSNASALKSQWDQFMTAIEGWGISDTPSGYSDLFLAIMERAYPCNGSAYCAPIEDPGVLSHLQEINPYYASAYFQASALRREHAEEIYQEYASKAGSSNTATNPGNSAGGSSVNTSGTMNVTSAGSVVNYAGDVVWNEAQLEIVKENQSIYQAAADKYGIKWELLATLHRLETGQRRENPGNGQGIYQLYTYTNGGSNSNAFLPAGPIDEKEFSRQTEIAAEMVKGMIEGGGYDSESEDGAKYVIFSYNGRASRYIAKALKMGFTQEEAEVGEGSPYVMNRYDARRDPNSSEMDPDWPGRFVADGVYDPSSTQSDFGGFVLYAALAGLGWSSSSGDCSETSGNGGEAIAEVARELAWPDNNHHNVVKPEFASAAEKVGSPTSLAFAQDCGHFVSVVVRYAEIDSEYPVGGTPNFESHMHKSDLWEEIANNGSEDNLEPGDIFVRNTGSGGFGSDIYPAAGFGAGGHIYIYLGDNEIASASLNERTGNLDKGIDFSNYRIFRTTVNSNSSGGTIGSFDEGLKQIESSNGVQVGVAVSEPGNKDTGKVQIGGSWKGERAWSTMKVPLSIAAIQKNASTGFVNDPYGGECSYSLSSAVTLAITQSDNCAAWWLWQALGGDNSSAAGYVTDVIRSGGDTSTSVTSSGDGGSLTSGMTTWSLVNQAIFMSNISSIDKSDSVINAMKTHNAEDGSHGLNTFSSISKGGWGPSNTRQIGVIKLNNGKCSAIAIGHNGGKNFNILDEIAQVLKNHQDDLPSGSCPGGL